MSTVSHSQDAAEDSFTAATGRAKAAGGPQKVRTALQLWDGSKYVGWHNQSWLVEVDDARKLKDFKENLELFFDLVAEATSAESLQIELEQIGMRWRQDRFRDSADRMLGKHAESLKKIGPE